ncbi:MAG: HPr family phosphocarrier protein, partial [Pseudomonadota bacterium]|nr:HPr family phosphocarrier protein [Pseudomonadota bacterium]
HRVQIDGGRSVSVAAAIERELTILNQRGLHARAAAKLCRLASGFDAEITVSRNEIDVSARSIMGLMLLAAAPGASIRVRAEGTEAAAAVLAIAGVVEGKFDED